MSRDSLTFLAESEFTASSTMRQATDQALLARAKGFEKEALSEIFDRFSPAIYRYAARLLGDSDLARECMAETFSRFLNALRRGVGPDDYLKAYLFRIAQNWVNDYYRRRPPPQVPLGPELLSDPAEEPHRVIDGEMEAERVRAALACLTPEQRQVIVLKYLEDWQNEDIARTLQKPVGAIKSLQHRAIEALRRMLLRQEENT